MATKRKRIEFTLLPEQKRRLCALASETDIPISVFVRDIVMRQIAILEAQKENGD